MEKDIGYGPGRRLFAAGTVCTKEEDMCRQSDKAAADINKIVARFDFDALNREFQAALDRGEPPWVASDVTEIASFAEMWARVAEATQYFEKLPPEIRAAFRNDPKEMISAWEQKEKRSVFEEMGLIAKEPVVAPSSPAGGPPVPPVTGQPVWGQGQNPPA